MSGADEWERNFLELQEEFFALQEKANKVDKHHRLELHNLYAQLDKIRQCNEHLEQDKRMLLAKLAERDDEIRYLQVELEAALADSQRERDGTSVSRIETENAIAYLKETFQDFTKLAKELNC